MFFALTPDYIDYNYDVVRTMMMHLQFPRGLDNAVVYWGTICVANMRGDVNVIDPGASAAACVELPYDFLADDRCVDRGLDGFFATVVRSEFVKSEGEDTKARPCRLTHGEHQPVASATQHAGRGNLVALRALRERSR